MKRSCNLSPMDLLNDSYIYFIPSQRNVVARNGPSRPRRLEPRCEALLEMHSAESGCNKVDATLWGVR
jgi:hypothetical protein